MNRSTRLQRLSTAGSLAALALASVPGATPALSARRASATLALESAKFTSRWHESRMTGSIVLSGRASQELQVTVGWFPAQLLDGDVPTVGPRGPTTASFRVGRSKFKRLVDVKGLFPGRFELAGYGRSGNEIYAIPGRVVVLAPPPEGVIGKAYVSATEHGRPVKRLPARSKAIYAHYIWAPGGRPAKPALTESWSAPTGAWASDHKASPGGFVAHAFAQHGKTLPSGTFHHVLRVLGRPVAQVSVRVG